MNLRGPILVTGAAGLIGSAVIWALNRAGRDDVLACDRLDRSEKWRNLAALQIRDYVDADALLSHLTTHADAYGEIGTILHLGACSSTTEQDSEYLMRNNFEFTKLLAKSALERDARFVYASSAATYGALEDGLDEKRPLSNLRPLNMYAYSKHLFDLYALRTGISDRIAGIKYFNVFGPNEAHKGDMRSMVAKAFEQIERDGSVQLFRSHRPDFADGEQRRDFVYVKDAVAMTLAIAENSSVNGIVNVGSGRASTWLDLIRPVFVALKKTERIDFVDMPLGIRAKYQYSTRASIDRIRNAGFTAPQMPLSEAVVEYVRDYLIPDRRLDPADA